VEREIAIKSQKEYPTGIFPEGVFLLQCLTQDLLRFFPVGVHDIGDAGDLGGLFGEDRQVVPG